MQYRIRHPTERHNNIPRTISKIHHQSHTGSFEGFSEVGVGDGVGRGVGVLTLFTSIMHPVIRTPLESSIPLHCCRISRSMLLEDCEAQVLGVPQVHVTSLRPTNTRRRADPNGRMNSGTCPEPKTFEMGPTSTSIDFSGAERRNEAQATGQASKTDRAPLAAYFVFTHSDGTLP